MIKTKKIWMDGKFVNWEDARIHVLTHTLHYGAGVFEGIRFYKTVDGAAIFRLKDHIDRFFDSAKLIGMKIPFSKKQINDAIIETVRVNKIDSGYIRPIAYYGYGSMGLDPSQSPVSVTIAVWPWGKYLGSAVKVKVTDYIRFHPRSTETEAKVCGHYINSILAHQQARKAGYDEALLLDYKGNVAEGPGENIFIVKHGKIKTPSLSGMIAGITRKSVIQIAIDLGYEVDETELGLEEVKEADDVFFTGTAAEVTVIKQIDDTVIKQGPITKKIQKEFYSVINGKNERYKSWLTFL